MFFIILQNMEAEFDGQDYFLFLEKKKKELLEVKKKLNLKQD